MRPQQSIINPSPDTVGRAPSAAQAGAQDASEQLISDRQQPSFAELFTGTAKT